MGEKLFGRFSDKKYALPFGRYVGSPEVEPPADEVLVGRESQRAYLIDLLISTGRRGAYLVTGRRGVGKTSFVKHCIAEYEASVLSRFLRANVGRGFWDSIFVLLFWLAILLGTLLVSEMLQLLVSSGAASQGRDTLRWLILSPVGILLLYPCVYAKVVFETIVQAKADLAAAPRQQNPRPQKTRLQKILGPAGMYAVIAVVFLGFALWFLPGSGEPASSIGFLIPMVSGLYLFVQAVSFEAPKTRLIRIMNWAQRIATLLFVAAVAAITIYCCSKLSARKDIFYLQLGLGLMLLGTGCLFRGVHQSKCAQLIERFRTTKFQESFASAIASGKRWYFAIGTLLLLTGGVLWGVKVPEESRWLTASLVLIPTFLFFVALPIRRHYEEGSPEATDVSLRFRPRPAWVLAAKAATSVVVAIQLAHPFLSSTLYQLLSSFFEPFDLCQQPSALWKGICDLGSSQANSLAVVTPLFSTGLQEELWLLVVLILLLGFQFLEYEWVIRPFLRSREEHSFADSGLAPWDDWENQDIPVAQRRQAYSRLAELTLPWVVHRNWLPVLPVSVNLGFDRLDHRQVIQAMLVGLRERYERTFLAWNSGFANLGRFLGFLILLALVTLATRGMPQISAPLSAGAPAGSNDGFDWAALLNRRISLEIPAAHPNDLLLFAFLPSSLDSGSRSLYFAVYHALFFLTFLLLGQWLLHRVPILPYKQNLRRIEDLLDNLSARTKITSRLNLWGPARWVHSIFSDERVRETERDPVDPRTVELAFLQILEDIQKGGFRFPGAARHHLTLPSPEITFIFDELDKLGTRIDPESETRSPSSPEQIKKLLYNEQERSLKLRALLSDLKNIIASAPARFIFVGGRDLHDEWLADHTARQPLLSSIFNTEVYLPSLLTDHGRRSPASRARLHQQVDLYLKHQYERAFYLSQRSVRKRWLPSFALSVDIIVQERFTSDESDTELSPLFDCATGEYLKVEGEALVRDFILFLTHRSMGNPKRLKDLLASFIRPSGREIEDKAIRWKLAPCRHIISFVDSDIFRIQLLVDIYRHLALTFEERMVNRDDKLAISIFFLTDFLFKFHRRAFSWSNLERVDDLAHVHRLPDLREIQEEIVDHFSERFLHRVLNGMYAFRFRSDIAREVEYLSRKSAPEMAAFNFTLDESQSLKAEYTAALKGSEGNNPDLVAALGELYEFDQDFERARHQYRMAIDLMDQELIEKVELVDPNLGKRPETTVLSILDGSHPEYARLFMPWGVARLRLMLQIGMTYEHERDLERAEAEYRSARTLARALVRAYVDLTGRGKAAKPELLKFFRKEQPLDRSSRLHTLKHMNIVFQPMFAEAWVSEKFIGSIDTSTSLVEKALREIRRALPFVRDTLPESLDDTKTSAHSHANFALTISQLHNKAGDLYFFKGRQPTTPLRIQELLKTLSRTERSTDRSTEGYLLRAHYHYAVSLHEIRRFIHHRVARSKDWLSIARSRTPTLLADAFPDFLFRAVGSCINDMAEATLARVSLFELFYRLARMSSREWEDTDQSDLKESCLIWLGARSEDTKGSKMANWFGWWLQQGAHEETLQDLIDFDGPDSADRRLFMSLKLCFVGADFLKEGGYPEDAGRELLQICETVTRYLWWGRMVEMMAQTVAAPGGKPGALPLMQGIFEEGSTRSFWCALINLAIQALTKADTLFRQSRCQQEASSQGMNGVTNSYIVGEVVPAEALTLLCSVCLAGGDLLEKQQSEILGNLLFEWTGEKSEDFADVLRRLLERHRYPMINRLNGLRVLIDHLVLTKCRKHSEAEDFAQAIIWTEELLDLNTQFDAPLHFTPLHSGATCALVWLWALKTSLKSDKEPAVHRIYRAAQRDLDNSEEMYTMRRAYYEAIGGLYYLYDDFNDRQIHFNHAIQMAGSELTAILKHLIGQRDRAPARKTV